MITKNVNTLRQEVHEHAAADAVVQGQYWEDGRGCFIGCLAHSGDPTPAVERFGLTTPILRIAEAIFEKLPLEEARQFFCDFPDAVAVDGKDLSLVHWQFLLETLQALPEQPTEIKAVIDPVIAGINSLASGDTWDEHAARDAARGAEDAAWAARAAAWAAEAAAAAARAAAWAAEVAIKDNVKAAEAAAWTARVARVAGAAAGAAAWDAAWAARAARAATRDADAAEAAETRRQRDSLLRLIREAPTTTPAGQEEA